MPETFDYATTNPGSGGTNLAGDTISQAGTSKFVPACYIVYGPQDGPYTRVDNLAGLPTQVGDDQGVAATSNDDSSTGILLSTRGLVTRSILYAYDSNNDVWSKLQVSNNALLVDGSASVQPVRQPLARTPSITNVASSATSVTLLTATDARLGATIYNDSTQVLYLKLGTTASTTSFTVKIVADGYYEVPFNYVGRIDGIWASANGSARITELS